MTGKKKWIFSYSMVFALTFLAVYSLQILSGRGFIYTEPTNSGDGLVEHYNSLLYYGEWLRTVFYNIFVEHRFSLPTWDFSIGLGGDVITTLSYYVLGDPLNLLAVLVPARYMEYLYHFLVIVRLYLSGLVFFLYCRHHHYDEKRILPGAMVYVFSFYTIVVSVLHPYFLNPLIYFPLILLGIDYVFEGKRPFLFIISSALAALTNFYFFYMLTMLMVLYAVIRYVAIYGKKEKIGFLLRLVGKFLLYYITALFLAMPVFLPSAYAVFGGNRVSAGAYVPVLYDLMYYVKLAIAFVNASADYYSALGYTAVGVLAVAFLFFKKSNKRRKQLKAAFILGTIFLLIPFCGHVLNGFSYVTNRWVWAYCFVVALIVVEMMPELISSMVKVRWAAVGITFLWGVLTFVFRSAGNSEKLIKSGIVLLVAVIFMVLWLCWQDVYKKNHGRTLMGILVVSLFLNAYGFYSPDSGDDLANHGMIGNAYEERMDSFFKIFEENEIDVSKVRIDTANLEQFKGVKINSAMMYDMNSTGFSYSVINDSTNAFLRDMELTMATDIKYIDMDSRTYLDAYLGCRYMVVEDEKEQYVPYGYGNLVLKEDGYAVYESENVLPFVYTYDSYMDDNDYEKLSALQKQQALVQTGAVKAVLAPADVKKLEAEEIVFSDELSAYEITEISDGIEMSDNRILVTKEEAYFTIAVKAAEDTERYLVFENLWYQGDGTAKIQITDGTVNKILSVKSPTDTMYSAIHDISCNLGYRKQQAEEITICFWQKGTYALDDLKVTELNMAGYDELLKNRAPKGVDYRFGEDEIIISACETEPKLLCVSVPFSRGWTALVDGEPADCLKVNNFNVGVWLEAGEHEVVFQYHTPYMKEGVVMMIIGLLICLLLWKWKNTGQYVSGMENSSQ